jgi:hypothetical protein
MQAWLCFNMSTHMIILLEGHNNLPFEDLSNRCFHQWEMVSDNKKSKEEVFLKCKKCGKIINWAAGG